MQKRCYYEVLGLHKGCDEASIKKAFRSLAMKYHPDRNPDDPAAVEKMKELNEAYAVLSNGDKRRLYDTYGHAGLQGYTQEDIFRGVDFGSILEGLFGGGFGFGEGIFDSFFGGGQRRSRGGKRPQKGADLRYDLTVTLEDVAFGKDTAIEFDSTVQCSACGGAGAAKEGLQTCDDCRGTGQVVSEHRSGVGVIRQISGCPKCRGKGRTIIDPCETCKGRGYVDEHKKIDINIPKGADTGYAIRVQSAGEAGANGGPSGDLYVVVRVEDHPVFERHGDDIYVSMEVEFPEAALGGELKGIPGLDGDLKVDIPEGSQNGAVIRLHDKGIPHLKSRGRGDQYVVLKVVTPTHLSKEEKDLLKKLRDLRKDRSRKASATQHGKR